MLFHMHLLETEACPLWDSRIQYLNTLYDGVRVQVFVFDSVSVWLRNYDFIRICLTQTLGPKDNCQ